MLSVCCSSTSLPLSYPLRLNSLDLAGVRLLSPRDSQILQKQLQVPTMPVQMMGSTSSGSSMRNVVVTMFLSWWSVVEPSWDDRGSSIWGYLNFIWILTVVGLCVYFGWCMNYIYVLCEVAIVSQLSLSHSCSLHGSVWRWPFLRQNHNAVMPLSRALTRGRYSRIVGVTSW